MYISRLCVKMTTNTERATIDEIFTVSLFRQDSVSAQTDFD